MGLITLGLSQIEVGTVDVTGNMPADGSLAKIGKTYKDTCKLAQAAADATEHYEEGAAAPEVRKKSRKMPILTFSIMDPSVTTLITYVGGENIGTEESPKWGYNGNENVENKAIRVKSEQGLWVDIPNADIEAVINADFSAKGLFMVDFTVTPMAVPTGKKAVHSYPSPGALVVSPTSLSFTSAADATGKTVTATSTGNVTYAAGPSNAEWLTVTKSAKVVTVKVSANANSEARTANVTIIADGKTVLVPVTQAGA